VKTVHNNLVRYEVFICKVVHHCNKILNLFMHNAFHKNTSGKWKIDIKIEAFKNDVCYFCPKA